jgi:hypothetical protein
MIQRRTHRALAAVIEDNAGSALAPAAFDPDITIVVVVPVAIDPASVRMWRSDIFTRDPDVGIAIPAVIAVTPGPVTMFGRGFGTALDDAGRGANPDNNLCACN